MIRSAVVLLVAAALLALPHQAQAQTTVKMVGNGTDSLTYSYLGTNFDGDYREVAQRFTTGSNTGGYTLSTAAIWFGALPTNAADISNFVAAIYTSTSNRPGTLKYTLTNPSGNFATTGRKDFSAPAASTLDAGTKYWLVLKNDNATDGENVTVNSTASGEDSNSLAGWSIQTQRFQRASRSGSWTSSASQLQIRISGYANASDDATLSGLELEDNNGTGITLSPMFASGTTTYTAMVGNPVDEITIDPTVNDTNAAYEIQNSGGTALTDADLNTTGFQVDLSLGANTIKVEVTAEDNTTQTYTVTVTRAPTAPNQPTGLTATANGATQIDLGWVAPADNGGATISGYKIEVSADGGTNWTDLLANTGTTSVTYSHTGLTRGSTRHYRVSAINAVGTGAASDPTSATTATPTPPAPVEITVPNDWSLIPTGLSTGDKFRLIFLSSTKTNATSTDIVDYNSFIQGRAAAGHTDIQTYSAGFRAVGCTADSDARDNTATTGTGVVIHWLNGNKVADDYADFYNGSWDDEANDKEEDGTDGPNTTINGNFPWTGCEHNGTEATFSGDSRALGAGTVRIGRPNSSVTNNGPLSSANNHSSSGRRLMYGLSQIFEVAAAANTAATGTPSIDGTPQVGMMLTAAKGTIADADGTTKADNGDTGYAYSYQWLRVDADGMSNETDIGADAVTYTPVAADVGKKVKVTVNFTDDGGTGEARTSNAFPSSGTITAETLPVLSISGITVDEDAGSATLTVELDPASTGTVTVDYATRDQVGGATAGDDYTATSGTLTFTAGQTSKTITVPITDDDIYENYEAFFVDLSNPTGATLPVHPTVAVGIDSEEVVPTASMADVTVDEGAGTMTLILRLSHLSHEDIAYSTVDTRVTGTATEGEDYDDFLLGPPAGAARITVPGGSLSQTFDITVVDDGVDEPDETIIILWQKVTGDDVTPTTFTFTGTIVTVPLPALSFVPTVVNVDEDAGSATLTVNLAPASTGTVTVDFATRDHDAKAGKDYTATSGTLTFTAGQTSKTITVPITDDDVYEAPGLTGEIFFINISNPTGATLPDPPFVGVIIDSEEAVPTASMADVTVDEGAGTMTLTLQLNHPSQEDITYFTREDDVTGTATEGEDYDDFLLETGRIARITVPAFNLSQTFDITLVDDGVDEADETIVIVWRKSIGDEVTPSTFTFTGTIVPEPLPALSFDSNEVTVDEDAGTVTLTVELDPASTGTVTVDFATRDGLGGAKAGDDYTATSGTLTFAATETSKTITVPITDDDVYENNESFQVDLSNPTGATLPDPPSAVVRIDSEEAVPTASLADVTVDEGAGTMTLTLRLSHPSDAETGYFTIYDEDDETGTATEGDDYDDFLLGPPGRTARITVPAGDLSQTFDITLVDDSEDEPDETIVILWTVFPNHDATPAAINFTGTITDNDTADNNPTVRFGASAYTAIEGLAGAVVTVLLDPAASRAVTIPVTTTPQGGASSADYSDVPGSVTFAAGETEQSFTVRATDDSADDDGESVQLGFGRLPAGVALGSPATATVALVAGSGVSTWFLFFEESSYTATEGGTAARVTVGLSNPWKPELNESLTIGIFTPEHRGGADAADYSGVPAQVTFQPGQTRVSFTVTATNDSDDDDGESIYLQFAGFDIEDLELDRAPRTTTVHLRDNDGAIAVQAFFGAQTYRVNEGSAVDVSVHLDKAPDRELTILITTAHGNGASSADYTGVPESITFSGSQSMRTFAVQALSDNVNDDQEYLTFSFGALPASVSAGDPATTTLNLVDTNDNIDVRTIYFDAQDTNVRELLEGSIYSLYVYLNSAADNDIVVPLQVTHLDGATTADYSGLPETVIIPAGERRENVIIRVLEDAEDDHGEGIEVRFGTLPRRVSKDSRADTATFRFLDNDTLPAISIAGADVKEWPNPQSYLKFVASLDYAPEFEVAVDYRTLNGSAVAGQDYESKSGTLTFAEGERAKYIRVLVCHDGIDESTETMTLQLSNPVRTKLEGNGSATGSIRNNNGSGAKPCATGISVSDVSAPEPNSNHLRRQEIEFEVSLNQADTGTVSVDYQTVEGTATAGQDYESASGTVTFRPGQTRRTVKVVVVADAHDDPGETFTLRLSNPSGAYIGDGEGTATLTNSGPMPGAWLSRFGRVASDHAVQAIEARIYDTSGHARENHLTIGGQRVDWQMLGRFAPSRDGRARPAG